MVARVKVRERRNAMPIRRPENVGFPEEATHSERQIWGRLEVTDQMKNQYMSIELRTLVIA